MAGIKKIKIAVNGGISFGSKLTAKQLVKIVQYIEDGEELELTTFQQLYLEIPEVNKEEIINDLESVGLKCYPVGNYVKSLRTCNFCKGAEAEGMPVAKELNNRVAGKPVPLTVRIAYTGCPIGCGEPLINDIGVMKVKDRYNLYAGGVSKGKDVQVGKLIFEDLEPQDLYEKIEKLIDIYATLGKKRETVRRFIERIGIEELLELMNQ